MKQIFNTLGLFFLITSIGFSQNTTGKKPVKKVVTSKITKDPKTGRVVKTVTTTTTTDIVLDPGRATTPVTKSNAEIREAEAKKITKQTKTKKPITKKPTSAAKPLVVTKKPSSQPKIVLSKPKSVVAKATTAPKKVVESAIIAEKPIEQPTEEVVKINEEKQAMSTPINIQKLANKQNTTNNQGKNSNKIVFKENIKINRFHLGVRGGGNFANVANVGSLTSISSAMVNNKPRLNAGIFANYAFNRVFSIQPELNYSEQGYDVTNGYKSETLKNQVINLPILLKASIGGQKFKVFANGGPYIGILLASKQTTLIASEKIVNYVDFDAEVAKEISVNRYDYGVQAGLGLQVNLGGPKLELEGRYNYGLADPKLYSINKPSYIGETGRNRILTGTIGLMFPIGK
jgi:Outer membrane protein beta-barrel domain